MTRFYGPFAFSIRFRQSGLSAGFTDEVSVSEPLTITRTYGIISVTGVHTVFCQRARALSPQSFARSNPGFLPYLLLFPMS